jgi:hypothetical protein
VRRQLDQHVFQSGEWDPETTAPLSTSGTGEKCAGTAAWRLYIVGFTEASSVLAVEFNLGGCRRVSELIARTQQDSQVLVRRNVRRLCRVTFEVIPTSKKELYDRVLCAATAEGAAMEI